MAWASQTPVVLGLRNLWRGLQRERIPGLAAIALALLFLSAVAVYVFEREGQEALITSFGEALWYSIVTMATVGYGDYTPKTVPGRVIGSLLILGGILIISFVSATAASILVAQKIREGRGLEAVKFREHLLICGWNAYAERVLDGLAGMPPGDRPQVVLVNQLPEEQTAEMVARARGLDMRYVRGDPATEAVLERANAREARAAIVLADISRESGVPSDERTTVVALALKHIKRDIKVSVEALDPKSEPHLRRAGADEIVISGEFDGFLLSSAAMAPGVSQVVREVLSVGRQELQRKAIAPEFVGRTFGELFSALRSAEGFLTLALATETRGLTLDDLLTDDYSLVDRFIRDQFGEAGAEHLRFEPGPIRVTVNPPDTYVIGPNDTAIGLPGQQ